MNISVTSKSLTLVVTCASHVKEALSMVDTLVILYFLTTLGFLPFIAILVPLTLKTFKVEILEKNK